MYKTLLFLSAFLCLNTLFAQVGLVTENVTVSQNRSTTISIFYPSEAHNSTLSVSDLSFNNSPDAEREYWATFHDVMKHIFGKRFSTDRDRFAKSIADASALTKLPVGNGVDPKKKNSPYPVLIYSPGFGLSRNANYAQVIELVKAEFIVVTVDHPNTGVPSTTILNDGTVVHCPIDHEISSYWGVTGDALGGRSPTVQERDKGWKAVFELRLKDIQATIDRLESLSVNPPFNGFFDLEALGVFGQSNGGATSAYALVNDDRVDAAVNMDGSLFQWALEYEDTEKPLLVTFVNAMNLPVQEAVECRTMNADFAKNVIYREMENFEHIDFTSLRLLEKHFDFKLASTRHHSPDPQKSNADLSLELINFFNKNLRK